VARMGLQAAVTIVDGQMASLDTAQKLVGLDDGSQLPYDLLVVATGLQVCTSQCCFSSSSRTLCSHTACCLLQLAQHSVGSTRVRLQG
jgi:hypothetical protein